MKKNITIIILSLVWLLPADARKITVNILHTSDTHSRIEPIPASSKDKYADRGGAARRAGIIQSERAKDKNTLLLDCGDFCQGTPYYNMFKGDVEVEMFNSMKYDAVAIGNHEFDFGLDNMARIFKKLKCPVVCANYITTGTPLEDCVKPYVIIKRYGLKIGIFGLGAKLEGLVQSSKCENIRFVDPATAAQDMVNLLRKEKKCDLVICLSHLGINTITPPNDNYLIANTSGIDLVLGGHSHTYLKELTYLKNKEGKPTPVLHSGKSGVNVGKVQLTVEKERIRK
jgi:5'-nucleotidase